MLEREVILGADILVRERLVFSFGPYKLEWLRLRSPESIWKSGLDWTECGFLRLKAHKPKKLSMCEKKFTPNGWSWRCKGTIPEETTRKKMVQKLVQIGTMCQLNVTTCYKYIELHRITIVHLRKFDEKVPCDLGVSWANQLSLRNQRYVVWLTAPEAYWLMLCRGTFAVKLPLGSSFGHDADILIKIIHIWLRILEVTFRCCSMFLRFCEAWAATLQQGPKTAVTLPEVIVLSWELCFPMFSKCVIFVSNFSLKIEVLYNSSVSDGAMFPRHPGAVWRGWNADRSAKNGFTWDHFFPAGYGKVAGDRQWPVSTGLATGLADKDLHWRCGWFGHGEAEGTTGG